MVSFSIQANAGIVLGGRMARPDAVDMRWMGAIVSRNSEVEETGLGAGVLNQPARGVAWLANRLAQYGILTADQSLAKRYLELGATFVAIGNDVSLLANGASRLLSEFQKMSADGAGSSGTAGAY